jgi:hypothetical protein
LNDTSRAMSSSHGYAIEGVSELPFAVWQQRRITTENKAATALVQSIGLNDFALLLTSIPTINSALVTFILNSSISTFP